MSSDNPLPPWLAALKQAVKNSSIAEVAKRLDVSKTLVSQVCNEKYPGDMARIQRLVEGAYLSRTVNCPILGEIRLDQCAAHQARRNVSSNPLYIQLYKACRSGCPHSQIAPEKQLKRPIRLSATPVVADEYNAALVVRRLTHQAAGNNKELVRLLTCELETLAMRYNQRIRQQGKKS